MREADPETVRQWLERADRITAPFPPPEGPLVANGTGWLLARGELHTRLWPEFDRWFGNGSVLGALAIAVARSVFKFSWSVGILAVGLGVATGFGVRHLLTSLKLAGWRRHAQAPAQLHELADGTLVRVTGSIVPQATVATLFRGRPAVLFRNQLGEVDETRGIDFQVQLDDGTRLTVDVRAALLLEPPSLVRTPPACGPVSVLAPRKEPARLHSDLLSPPSLWSRLHRRHESSVQPGDLVEIIGYLDGTIVSGTAELPLQVRRVHPQVAAG